MGTLYLGEQAVPSTPPAAQIVLYPKADGLLYWKDDAGVEYPIVGTAGTSIALSSTTDSTSIVTGSFTTLGGVGVTKALWVGGLANIAGAVTLQSTLGVTGATTLGTAKATSLGVSGTRAADVASTMFMEYSAGGRLIIEGSGVGVYPSFTIYLADSAGGVGYTPLSISAAGAVTIPGTLGVTGGVYPGATQTAAALISQASSGAGTTTTYIGNQTITTASDERIKTGVRLWDGNASAILRGLPVKAWDRYTSDAPIGGYEGGYVGFTAQDLHKAAPWAVNTQGDTGLPWQARYEFLNGIIVKALQEQDARVRALEAR